MVILLASNKRQTNNTGTNTLQISDVNKIVKDTTNIADFVQHLDNAHATNY